MSNFSKIGLLCLSLYSMSARAADLDEYTPQCKPFKEIYKSGKELCENMWDGAFKYETDEEHAYSMWFFDANNNPNDAITAKLAAKNVFSLPSLPVDKCHLQYFHKETANPLQPLENVDHPLTNPGEFTECHPWRERSCCHHETVATPKKMNDGYGDHYHWDRCGPLSQACERYFVQEACFYECEPNAGIYRKFKASADDPDPFQGAHGLHSEDSETTNAWQMHQMPIKASFCDGWLAACAEDLFCASDSGSLFSCAKEWKPIDILSQTPSRPGSCRGSCGGQSKNGTCMCDEECEKADPNTCCADRAEKCKPEWVPQIIGSCEDACGKKTKTPEGNCWCDKGCAAKGDCCEDKQEVCQKKVERHGTCDQRCGKKGNPVGTKPVNCYCDNQCQTQVPSDCCPDIKDYCDAEALGGEEDCGSAC